METYNMTPKAKAITNSRKRKFYFHKRTVGAPNNTASYWDGGSRDVYSVLNIMTGQSKTPPVGQYPTYQASYTLEPNEILICTGTFLGKPATPSITCRVDEEMAVKQFLGI